jgi:aspartate aminotransferase
MLSSRARGLVRSPTVTATERARKLRDEGRDIISLTAGEPLDAPPPHVLAAAAEAPSKGFTKYPPIAGYPDLRQAIAKQYLALSGVRVDPDQVVVSAGAKQAVWNAVLALVSPGERVILPTPIWGSFAEMIRLAQGEPLLMPCAPSRRFRIDPADLDRELSQAKGMIMNSPGNPTGATWTPDELSEIAQVIRRHPHAFVVTDEIYARIFFGSERAPGLLQVAPDLAPRVIVADGVSKSYAMTGFRIGWTISPREVAGAIKDFQGQTTSGAAAASQRAAFAAIEGPQDFVATQRSAYKQRCSRATAALREIPGVTCFEPEGAFYAFPDVSELCRRKGIASSADMRDQLLERTGLAVNSADGFFTEGYLRFSLAPSDRDVDEGLRRFASFARG